MKRVLGPSVLVVALAAAAQAVAGETPERSAPGITTVKTNLAAVTFSGGLSFSGVYRDRDYFGATKGNGLDATGLYPGTTDPVFVAEDGLTLADRVGGLGDTDRDDSEFYFDPNLYLNFAVDVGDKARGVIEIRTPWYNPDAGGKNASPGTGYFDGFSQRTLELKQVYAQVDELLPPGANEPGSGLLLRAGIMDFWKDLRGEKTRNPFIIDVSGSEHPFDGFDPTTTGYLGTPTYGTMRYSTGAADSMEAAGGYARYRVAFIDLDGWVFNLDEAYNSDSYARKDMLFYGGSTDFWFDDDRRIGKVFLTVFDLMNQSSTHLVTEGGGVVFNPFYSRETQVNFLQLYGEIYFQQGSYAKGVPVLGTIDRIKQQDAYAFQFGIEGKTNPMKVFGDMDFTPYAEGSYVQVSGDDEANDNVNSNFISLENNNRTVVVENGYYGFDIDTNYRGPRIAAGVHLGKWQLELLYAYFEFVKNGGNRISGGGSESNKIGDEIDVTLAYEYTEALEFALKTGWLLDSHGLGQTEATNVTLFTVSLGF